MGQIAIASRCSHLDILFSTPRKPPAPRSLLPQSPPRHCCKLPGRHGTHQLAAQVCTPRVSRVRSARMVDPTRQREQSDAVRDGDCVRRKDAPTRACGAMHVCKIHDHCAACCGERCHFPLAGITRLAAVRIKVAGNNHQRPLADQGASHLKGVPGKDA